MSIWFESFCFVKLYFQYGLSLLLLSFDIQYFLSHISRVNKLNPPNFIGNANNLLSLSEHMYPPVIAEKKVLMA